MELDINTGPSDNGSFVPEDHIGYPVQPWLTASETDDQQPFLN